MRMSLEGRFEEVRSQVSSHVRLVVVSKRRTASDVKTLYDKGQRLFGENRVQELLDKSARLPSDILWHMIGNVQTNKVKPLVSLSSLSCIQSVGSVKLLTEINKCSESVHRKMDILMQLKVAKEDTKIGGLLPSGISDFLQHVSSCPAITLRGIMGMGTHTKDKIILREEFSFLRKQFLQIRDRLGQTSFDTLSMGMTNDYLLAMEEGSNMIRIGSGIFAS